MTPIRIKVDENKEFSLTWDFLGLSLLFKETTVINTFGRKK